MSHRSRRRRPKRPTTNDPAPTTTDSRPSRVFSVTELTVRVRDLLEEQFAEVWVEGELSGCRLWNTGHLYFTLKDGASQIKAVIFRSALRYLKFKPADGLRVVARGRVSVYEPKGEYQLVCEHLEPHGLGALQLAFDQLKKRLQDEGLFDAARKRPLPALPRKIGIVTSLDGAAIRDIIKVLRRRYANAHLVICPGARAGRGRGAGDRARAAADRARARRRRRRDRRPRRRVDRRSVGVQRGNRRAGDRAGAGAGDLGGRPRDRRHDRRLRGGRARADAVGGGGARRRGERRVRAAGSIACATASRAARARVQGLSRRVHMVDGRPAFAGFRGRVAMRGRHAAELSHALARVVRAGLAARERRRQQLERQLSTFDAGRRLASIRTRLVASRGRLETAVRRRQHRAAAQLGNVAGRLDTLSPLAVLGRGYAVAWNADRTRVMRDAAAVAPGDTIHVTLSRGEIDAKVTKAE